jgi:hypothetical protein
VERKVDHESLGSSKITAGISEKFDDLREIAEDLGLCLKCRIAAWHVLCLYPGEPQLKAARRGSIEESIRSLKALGECTMEVRNEIDAVDSFWNREETLRARRKQLYGQCDRTLKTIAQKTDEGSGAIGQVEQLMLASGRPTRILLEYEGGELVNARQE